MISASAKSTALSISTASSSAYAIDETTGETTTSTASATATETATATATATSNTFNDAMNNAIEISSSIAMKISSENALKLSNNIALTNSINEIFTENETILKLQKQIDDIKIHIGYGQTISKNIYNNILLSLEQYENNHEGAFIHGGNSKSNQSFFSGIGKSSVNSEFNENSIMWWASGGKLLTGLVCTKMIEENIITPSSTLYSINKIFDGIGTYYTNIEVLNKDTFPFDVNSYKATTNTFNWKDITINDLLHLNIGLSTDFIICADLFVLLFTPGFGIREQILADNSVIGLGAYLQTATYFTQMIQGNALNVASKLYSGYTIEDTLSTYLKDIIYANCSGLLPLFCKPATYSKNVLPYGTNGLPSAYDTGYLFLGAILDPSLKIAGYKNYAEYARIKFFEPLAMDNSYVVPQEVVPESKRANIINSSFRRATSLGLTQVFDINDIKTWSGYGCDPKYSTYNNSDPIGKLVWINDYPDDGISKILGCMYNNIAYPELQVLTNAPLMSSIKDYGKLLCLLSNNGYYNGKMILKPESFNYLISPKIPITSSSVQSFPYPYDNFNNTNDNWCMGFARINRDLTSYTTYGFSNYTLLWDGFSGISFYINFETGTWFVYGIPESILSSGTIPIPYIGSPAYSDELTSNFLINIMKD